jgi:hypothetical protein
VAGVIAEVAAVGTSTAHLKALSALLHIAAQDIVDDILTDPKSFIQRGYTLALEIFMRSFRDLEL